MFSSSQVGVGSEQSKVRGAESTEEEESRGRSRGDGGMRIARNGGVCQWRIYSVGFPALQFVWGWDFGLLGIPFSFFFFLRGVGG
jgi:hypothetical protein